LYLGNSELEQEFAEAKPIERTFLMQFFINRELSEDPGLRANSGYTRSPLTYRDDLRLCSTLGFQFDILSRSFTTLSFNL